MGLRDSTRLAKWVNGILLWLIGTMLISVLFTDSEVGHILAVIWLFTFPVVFYFIARVPKGQHKTSVVNGILNILLYSPKGSILQRTCLECGRLGEMKKAIDKNKYQFIILLGLMAGLFPGVILYVYFDDKFICSNCGSLDKHLPHFNDINLSGNEIKQCPYCAEDIKKEAIFCKHCRKDLQSAK